MTDLPDNNPKTAVGRLKPPVRAIPPSAIIALGLAMENGELKYGLMNWRTRDVSSSVYYDAAMRHLMSWWDGEDRAADSNVHHLAHVMACCAILIDAEINGNLHDDRPARGPVAAMITTIWNDRTAALATEIVQAQGPVPVAEPANADICADEEVFDWTPTDDGWEEPPNDLNHA